MGVKAHYESNHGEFRRQTALTYRRRASRKGTTLGLSAAQIRSPEKDFNLAMTARRAALSGNALLIASFLSFIFDVTTVTSRIGTILQ